MRRKRVPSVWRTLKGEAIYALYKGGKLTKEQACARAGVSRHSLARYEAWRDPNRKPYGALAMDRNWSMPREEVDTFLRTADIAGAAVREVWKREKAALMAENQQLKQANAELHRLLAEAKQRFEQAAKEGGDTVR